MNTWLPVKEQEFDKAKSKTVDGVTVQVSLSPYDIPEAVRGYREIKSPWFVIEFRYIANEPTREQSVDQNLGLVLGKHSGRVFAIKVNVEELKAKTVKLDLKIKLKEAVADAIDNLPKFLGQRHHGPSTSRLTHGMKEVIEKNRIPLFSEPDITPLVVASRLATAN